MFSPFKQRLLAAWGLTALAFLPVVANASEAVWVRIDGPMPAGVAARHLTDYTHFSWGQVSAGQLRQLQASGASVQVIERPFELHLGGMSFDPLTDFPRLASQSAPREAGANFRLVQFNGPIRPEWTQSMREAGMEVVQYIHPFTYVVWADEAQMSGARSMSGVRWVGEFAPEFRVVPEQRGGGDEVEATMVVVSRHADQDHVHAQLTERGAQVLRSTPYMGHFQLLEVAAPGQAYMALGHVPAVYTVQRALLVEARGEMSNQAIVGDFSSNQDAVPGYAHWLANTGYDGTGVRVSVIDGGIRTTHQDLAGAVDPCVPAGDPTSCSENPGSGHGTHVAGAIAGRAVTGTTDANGFLRGQGVAPGARLVQQRYGDLTMGFGSSCNNPSGPYCITPSGMLTLFKEASLSGATHANNSWGSTNFKIGYDLPSQQVDAMVRDADPALAGAQQILPVWSIANGGGTRAGACNSNSLGSPDEAKNLFAIGSTQLTPGSYSGGTVSNPSDFFRVSHNSAHGPACDGRVGVHLVAPGCGTDAPVANSNTAYAVYCGTSMASPVVSGSLAIFIERYRDLYNTTPSPAMMKAALMGTAINMHGRRNANGGFITETPSRYQGYGRLDLDASVNPPFKVMYFDQETVFENTGEEWGFSFKADDPSQPVRMMLVWTDAPGSGLAGATPAWVNDLDLRVSLGGDEYLGNVIGSDGYSETGGNADTRNNMEAVFLSPTQHAGNVFQLTVAASNIAADALDPHNPGAPRQDFALVCYNCDFGEPGFTLQVAPPAAVVCVPESGSTELALDVSVGVQGSYAGNVALSGSDEPAGVGSSFSPATVTAPGNAVWTLSIADSASAGISAIHLTGSDGSTTQTTPFMLTLDATLQGPTLQQPADASTDVALRPNFRWEAVEGATHYRIQVASDPGFANLLVDETTEETEFTPATAFANGANLHWRVLPVNSCDGNVWSATASFQIMLNPVASIAPLSFAFTLPADVSAQQVLHIENTGTGNLLWNIHTDAPRPLRSAGGRDFAGAFAFDNWTFSNTPVTVAGSHVINHGPPQTLHVTGGNAGVGGNSDFSIQVPQDGIIHFDWGFQSNDVGQLDSGGYVRNGSYTVLAYSNSEVAYFESSTSVPVSAGDTFAFRAYTRDGRYGSGTLGVTNFLFEPTACADVEQVPWLSVSPASGQTAAGATADVSVNVDANGLSEGRHEAWLCVNSNTTVGLQQIAIPVQLDVTPPEKIFDDGFEALRETP